MRAINWKDGADQFPAKIVEVCNAPIRHIEKDEAQNHPKRCDKETEEGRQSYIFPHSRRSLRNLR